MEKNIGIQRTIMLENETKTDYESSTKMFIRNDVFTVSPAEILNLFTTVEFAWPDTNITNSDLSQSSTEFPASTSGITAYTVMTAFTLLFAIFIVTVNSMVVAAPFVSRHLRKKTFYFVSSLAVADILTALVHSAVRCMVLVKDLAAPWLRHQEYHYCQTVLFFLAFPQLASITNLLLMGLDRYIAICHPLKYNFLLHNSTCLILVVLAWTFSISAGLLTYGWHKIYLDGFMDCQVTDLDPYYYDFIVAMPLYIITVTLIILYINVGMIIKRSTEMTSSSGDFRVNTQHAVSEKKTTKMLFITLVVFALSWLPHILILHFVIRRTLPITFSYVPYTVAYMNSGMNFFIYTFGSPKYKAAFKKMCCYGDRKPQTHQSVFYVAKTETYASKTDITYIEA